MNSFRPQAGSASKTVVVLLASIILLLVAAIGGGAWALTSGKLDGFLNGSQQEEPEPEPAPEPLFKPLEKFVVSLANDRVQHYMMLELTLVSHDPEMPAQAEKLESVIRNALLKHFARQTRQSVREEMENIDAMQENLRLTMQLAAENYGQVLSVEKLLITNVVIQ